MDVNVTPGSRATLLGKSNKSPATINSSGFNLRPNGGGGGGGIIYLVVTAVTGGGSISTVNVQARVGTEYLTVMTFGSLAINATGLYAIRIHPGAATANSWKAVAQDILPVIGRIQVVVAGAAVEFQAILEGT